MFQAIKYPIDYIKGSNEYQKLYDYGIGVDKKNPFASMTKPETLFFASVCLPFLL
jgi:hypothetical protein